MNTALEPLEHAPDTYQISQEMQDGMDETLLYAEDMRNLLVRAEFVARQRRFDSKFGELV